jgi:hypothetical protein
MTVADARSYLTVTALRAIDAGGYTNYDAALSTSETVKWDGSTGSITGTNVNNAVYFLSDGQPTEGTSSTGVVTVNNTFSLTPGTAAYEAQTIGIQSGEETTWSNYLNTNKVNSYALGIGADLTMASAPYLDPIAFNGISQTNTDAVVISDITNLQNTLVNDVSVQGTSFNGNILSNDSGGEGGTVDPTLVSFTVGGATYTFDDSHTSYTVDLGVGKGSIVINNNGDYVYTPATLNVVTTPFAINYTMSGEEGVTASSTLTITPAPIVLAPDTVTVNEEVEISIRQVKL